MKLILLISCFISIYANAQHLPFDPEQSKGELYEYAAYTTTEDKDFSFQDIVQTDSLEFKPLESDNYSVGFTSDNYWVRFRLQNTSDDKKVYYLETARPVTDYAYLYQIENNGLKQFSSGDQIPFNERQVQHRSTIFKIQLPPNSNQQFYIHLKSDGETLNIPLNLFTESAFWISNYKQQLFLGLFYGLLFLAGTIYLFFYRSLKEKSFLYYGCYVFFIGFLQAALDGLINQYIIPQGGYFYSRTVLITGLLTTYFVMKYCEHFLKLELHLKGFKKIYNVFYYIILILFVMIFISPTTMEIVYPLINLNGLIALFLILATLVTMRKKHIHIDPYFLVGILFLVIGIAGFLMNNLSLLPNNFFTLNCVKFGTGLEVIFLSLSMTNLIRKLREEKEDSQFEALGKSQEISQLKTYFMSNMSHELRTPINAIIGIAELEVKNNTSTVADRKQFEIIKNASLSLLSTVNDILDFEKIEKNELELKHEPFNPSIALHQISNNWKFEAKNKGLEYQFEMDHEIPTMVVADQERFIQIVNNVLGNAVKFTTSGYVHFKLKCLNQSNNICSFSMQISDTGVGMHTERKKVVFDSYSQMRLNNKRQFGGIGLGMNIVKYLVKLFDGSVHLESELGKGTDVYIELPMRLMTEGKRNSAVPIKLQDLAPQHVLIVEDNKINQMVMRKLLASSSHISFAVVNNGEEAIEALQRDVYDLVLMDLQMPVMDGYEATKIIRSGRLGQAIGNIPIIAVTADAMQETRRRVLDLGMNDYITKPVNRELLLSKIDTCQTDSKLKIA